MTVGFGALVPLVDAQSQTMHTNSLLTASFAKTVALPAVAPLEEAVPTGNNNSKAQMRQNLTADRNAFNATSMASTAHEALGEMANVFHRMRDIVVAGASSSLSSADLSSLQKNYADLQSELESLRENATYNGADLLGPNAQPVTFDLSPAGDSSSRVQLNLSDMSLTLPPVSSVANGSEQDTQSALASIDGAIAKTATARADLGETLNMIQKTTQQVQTTRLNSAAAISRVSDVTVAEEMARLSGDLVVRQPGVSVLGQTRELPQLSLRLLR
jgi:flagellin